MARIERSAGQARRLPEYSVRYFPKRLSREIVMTNTRIVCGEPAFAYRLEASGGKSYLCDKHVPVDDVPEARVMADEGKGADGAAPE
jgi:hypothetical protein